MNIYTNALKRFQRLEKIAFEIGRGDIHFKNPKILNDVIEARDENDYIDKLLAERYPIF